MLSVASEMLSAPKRSFRMPISSMCSGRLSPAATATAMPSAMAAARPAPPPDPLVDAVV